MFKLTIITINYNNVLGLQKTIESVVNQTCKEFEYIVIDGGSNDDSVNIIKQYANQINYWVSEPDNGIYNAMNKGIAKANGEYLLFLNSGDCLISKTILQEINNHLKDYDVVYGDGLLENNTRITVPEILNKQYFYSQSLFHPSAFIKRKLFFEQGLYNEKNKIISDWEFFIKLFFFNNATSKKINCVISIIEEGGISRDGKYKKLLKKEMKDVHEKYFSKSEKIKFCFYNILSKLKVV